MSKGPWMRIDPEVHLKGATPETLAAALLRNRLLPRGVEKPVGGDKVAPEKPLTDKPGDGIAHLRDGS